MAIWEYKVITSGKGGFATPAMMEKFLNDLGKESWEIIAFQSAPENALAFNGLARRSTQRDWTLEDAAATAAKAEADKVRAEFEAKFKGLAPTGGAALAEEPAAADDGYRSPVDTSRDQDPDAPDEEHDEWEQLDAEEELPTFFDAIKPHLRRNQRGAGQSVGVDYLAKKWGFDEADIAGALKECGFVIPDDENAAPHYLEYDGDLFWVNINRRGEVWINTKEKPQPKFRVVPGAPVAVEESEKQDDGQASARQREEKPAEPKPQPASKGEPVKLPEGPALLDLIRPKMRRNRDDAGGSGSTSFLSRAFRCKEADLLAAFATLGLVMPEEGKDKPAPVQIGDEQWWLNRDQRGGVWINGKPKSAEAAAAAVSKPDGTAIAAAPVENSAPPAGDSILLQLRPLLKGTRTGAFAAEVARLAEAQGCPEDGFTAALVAAGLKVPEKAREKPVFVELKGEIYWLNKNAKDQLWLNAKASKFNSDDAGESKPKRARSRKSAPAE
ncbi:MAG: hypothetical protein IT582_11470 [Opitutaceae bacterium]|nr:hypothetical protein [Opitutaceae bacterium]